MISKIRYLLIGLAGLLIGAGGLVSLYHLAYGQKIYPHVVVGAVEISNLSIEEAEKELAAWLPTELPEISLEFGNQSWPVSLADLGLKYLTKETAETAFLGGRGNGIIKDFQVKWRRWWQPESLALKFNLNQEKLGEIAEMTAAELDEEPIMPTLSLTKEKKVELISGRSGRLVDKEKLKETIINQLGEVSFKPIEIPIILVRIETTTEESANAQARAEKFKDKKVSLKYDTKEISLEGQGLIDLIDFSTKGGQEAGWSEEKIASLAANLALSIDRPTQNASFNFDGNKVVEFKPAIKGLKVNQAETAKAIGAKLEQMENQEEDNIVKIVISESEPEIQTGDINNLGIKELVGKGESTFHGSIASREHNVALTAAKLNGVLVAPGDVFSFNQTVGDISAATGFQAAYIIKDGRTILGDGGGVCQDSTTLFRAILDAGLPILERQAHAYRVSYYEQNAKPGFDATVYDPTADLKFKNDTPGHILIQTKVDLAKNYLRIEFYGTGDGRKVSIGNIRLWNQTPPPPDIYQDDPSLPAGTVKQVDWKAWGAKAAFDWKVVRNGEVLQEKTFFSNYRPWQAVYLKGTGG